MESSKLKTDQTEAPISQFSDARTQLLADAIPSMVWTCRSDGYVDYLNEKWYLLTGQSPDEAIGWGWTEIIHPDDRDRVMSKWKKAIESGGDYEIEHRYKMANGRFYWHLVRAVPVRDEDGNIDHWFGVSTDIDDKHETEELSEATTKAIVETAVDGIITIDDRGTIQTANPAIDRIFGYRFSEIRGQNIKMLMPEPYQSEHDGYLANYQRTGHKKIIGIGREVIGKRKDGSEFPMELGVSEIKARGHRLFTGVIRDITKQRQLENDLRGQARVLERVANGDSLTDVLNTLIEVAEASRPEMIGSILLLDKESNCLRYGASRQLPDFYREAIVGIEPGHGICPCGAAVLSGKRVIVEDISAHPFSQDYRKITQRAGLQACWSEPILSSNGDVLGTFAMYYREPRSPDAQDLEFVASSANIAATVIERAQARQAHSQKNALFETTVNGIPDSMLLADLDRKLTYVNPGACRMFGYTSEELIGQSGSLLYAEPAEFFQQGKERFNQDAGEQYEVIEVNWRRKNGEVFVGETVGTVVRDEVGKPIGFVGLIRDITERKRAEKVILESERKLSTLLSNLPGAAYRCRFDDELSMEYISDGCLELMGYLPTEVVSGAMLILPEDFADVTENLQRALTERKSYEFVHRIRHRSGEKRWVWTKGQGVYSDDGELKAFEGFVSDMTELHQAREKLVQSERLAAMGQMMSSIAHESRNALQRIQAGVDMLKLDIPEDSEAGGDLAQIAQAQNDLQTLLEGMRDFAAPVKLDLQKSNLADVWQQMWRNLECQRENRQATLVEETSDVDLQCTVDPFRIEQIFRNLVENSLAACSDPVEIKISTSNAELNGVPAVSISVRDNGPGLTQEQQDRIFEAFYTTKPKGTGLGMAIALKTIAAHQGTLVAGNGKEGGAEFVITLPREQR